MSETGDSVCWLEHLCPECDAMLDAGAGTCWRCGAQAPTGPASTKS